MGIIAVVGVVTALMAGTIGVVQNDIKRVLAYSTVSQLGYMFLAMGVGAFGAGIFHLYTHAFFKALLFLGAGAVIHALAGEQDLRRMGGLWRQLPITYVTFLVGALAIAGIPGLAGFFSKDEILFRTFDAGHPLLWTMGVVTSLLTAIYMFRLVFLVFHGHRAADAVAHEHSGEEGATVHDGQAAGRHHAHDAPPAMAFALVLLAVGSIAAGYIGLPHALGGSNLLERFLAPSFGAESAAGEAATPAGPAEVVEGSGAVAAAQEATLELRLMGVSTGVALAGIVVAVFFFQWNRRAASRLAARVPGLYRLLLNKYYVDEIYDAAIVRPIGRVSEETLWKRVDAGGIDAAVNGVAGALGLFGSGLRGWQTGSVRTYAASLLFGVVLVIGYYLWR
jgi:NADH-quinone oxidoreductase subunit L